MVGPNSDWVLDESISKFNQQPGEFDQVEDTTAESDDSLQTKSRQ